MAPSSTKDSSSLPPTSPASVRKSALLNGTEPSSPNKKKSSSKKSSKKNNGEMMTAQEALDFLSPPGAVKVRGRRASVAFTDVPDFQLFEPASPSKGNAKPVLKAKPEKMINRTTSDSTRKTSSSSRRSSSKPVLDPAAQETNAPFWKDRMLLKSKIVRKRLFTAATKIQTLVRGFLQRRRHADALILYRQGLYARKIQTQYRGHQARQLRIQIKAARDIQRVFRGCWCGKLLAQIQAQHNKLEAIERGRQLKLNRIDDWKNQEITEIEKLIEDQLAGFCEVRAKARLNMDVIAELREKNLKAAEVGKRLDAECEEIRQANKALTKEHKTIFQKSGELRQEMNFEQKEYAEWQKVADRFENRLKEYEGHLYEREIKLMLEETTKRNCMRTIGSIARHLQRNDLELFFELEEQGLFKSVRNKFSRSVSMSGSMLRAKIQQAAEEDKKAMRGTRRKVGRRASLRM